MLKHSSRWLLEWRIWNAVICVQSCPSPTGRAAFRSVLRSGPLPARLTLRSGWLVTGGVGGWIRAVLKLSRNGANLTEGSASLGRFRGKHRRSCAYGLIMLIFIRIQRVKVSLHTQFKVPRICPSWLIYLMPLAALQHCLYAVVKNDYIHMRDVSNSARDQQLLCLKGKSRSLLCTWTF